MAMFFDPDQATSLADGKLGPSLAPKEISCMARTSTGRIPYGSHFGKENYSPGHGALNFSGQSYDTDYSRYPGGPESEHTAYESRHNFMLQSSSCFTDDGSHCNEETNLASGRFLAPPQIEAVGDNAHGDVYYSHGRDSASDPDCWRSDEMAHLMWYMGDVNNPRTNGHTWGTDNSVNVPLPGRDYTQEALASAQLELVADDVSARTADTSPKHYDEHVRGIDSSADCQSNASPQSQETLSSYVDVHVSTILPDPPHVALAEGLPGKNSSEHNVPGSGAGTGPGSESIPLKRTYTDGSRHSSPSSGSLDGEELDEPESDMTRNHPLYTRAEPGKDGQYHCPFKGKEPCHHDPTPLKCNYDKYVDSHLKPHRCRAPECQGLRFSSTACRLRHEREAHGSHGHGLRPYVCLYSDCDRSKPGNGFPRSWNCNDHMRRVHGHVVTVDPENKSSPSVLPDGGGTTDAANAASPPTSIPRKRAKSGAQHTEVGKRSKVSGQRDSSTGTARPSAKSRATKLIHLQEEWREQFSRVHKRIHELRGPLDLKAIQDFYEESGELLSLSEVIVQESKRKTGDRSRR